MKNLYKKSFKNLKNFSTFLLLVSPIIANYPINECQANNDKATGQFIKVSGEKLHYLYTGQTHATPLVVLVAGNGCSLQEWSIVQSQISKFSRVVSYDRKGFGLSPLSKQPRILENLAQDLYQLLKTLPGPYILVGHSMAGIIIDELINDYPDLNVESVVFVDAIEGDFKNSISEILQNAPTKMEKALNSYSDYFRFNNWLFANDDQNNGKPELFRPFDIWTKEIMAINSYARDLSGTYAETSTKYQGKPTFMYNIERANSINNILIEKKLPVHIISSETCNKSQSQDSSINKIFKRVQDDLKKKYGNQTIAKGSDHFITRHAPQVIIDCIYNIIEPTKK